MEECDIKPSGMQGRVKRKLQSRKFEERAARTQGEDQPACALCHRLLGSLVEWHHFVPKSKGGTATVPVHPICHRAIHARVSIHELATTYADMDVLRARDDMQTFVRWIRNKPVDFNAPTRRKRAAQ